MASGRLSPWQPIQALVAVLQVLESTALVFPEQTSENAVGLFPIVGDQQQVQVGVQGTHSRRPAGRSRVRCLLWRSGTGNVDPPTTTGARLARVRTIMTFMPQTCIDHCSGVECRGDFLVPPLSARFSRSVCWVSRRMCERRPALVASPRRHRRLASVVPAARPHACAIGQMLPRLPGSWSKVSFDSQDRNRNVIATGALGKAGATMSVTRLPGGTKFPPHLEEDVSGYGAETDPYAGDEDIQFRAGREAAWPDYGADDPGQTSGDKYAGRSRQRNGRLSPADVIARSLFPVGHVRSRSGPGPTSPVDVIAQALCPTMRDSAQDLLKQSFWQVWLQHRDYLKKKAFIFWTATARMPRMP